MLVKILLIIFMFSENNGKKVDLLKPNPLNERESKEGGRGKGGRGAARTELMARGAKVRAENKLILRAETEVLSNSASYKSEWKEIM